jgi:hypothetical protein
MVAGLRGAAADEVALGAEASGRPAKLATPVLEIPAADVPQLDPLEGVPDALVRVRCRRVARERLQPDTLGPAVRRAVLDRLAAVDRRTLPDDRPLAGDGAQQGPEEADHVRALVGPLLHQQEQPARRGEAADDRQVVTAQRQAAGRRLPARGVGPDGSGQQGGAGRVYPDDRPPFPVGPFPRAGQRSACRAAIAAASRRVARRIGFGGLQPAARRSVPT